MTEPRPGDSLDVTLRRFRRETQPIVAEATRRSRQGHLTRGQRRRTKAGRAKRRQWRRRQEQDV
jgi:ribosomal protein S21